MQSCTKNEQQHKDCKNEEKLYVCMKCKRFYENGYYCKDLRDLFMRK